MIYVREDPKSDKRQKIENNKIADAKPKTPIRAVLKKFTTRKPKTNDNEKKIEEKPVTKTKSVLTPSSDTKTSKTVAKKEPTKEKVTTKARCTFSYFILITN